MTECLVLDIMDIYVSRYGGGGKITQIMPINAGETDRPIDISQKKMILSTAKVDE